jgi:hypothetical protein
MSPGGNFWKNAAILGMNVYLAGDNITENRRPVLNNGRCRLITGCFYCENSCLLSHNFEVIVSFISVDVNMLVDLAIAILFTADCVE